MTTIEQVVREASDGEQIAVVGQHAREMFHDIRAAAIAQGAVADVRHGSGVEAVRFLSGGRIDFHVSADRLRGASLDRVYATTEQESRDRRLLDMAEICLASSSRWPAVSFLQRR